jgi:GTP pyrophosphokinase
MEDRSRLGAAFDMAARLHDGQPRKGTSIPYISHPMAVASLVLEHGGSAEQAIAALLHDGPEDGGGRPVLTEIRERFGEAVARIVEECTDTFDHPKPPWRPRKERYLRHLESASPDTILVSLADKTHNLRTILRDHRAVGESLWKRFAGGKEGTRWYYESLLEAYRDRVPPAAEPLFAEYERMVERLRGF